MLRGKLREIRQSANLSQADMAKHCMLSLDRYILIEDGVLYPSSHEEQKIDEVTRRIALRRSDALMKLARWNAANTPKPASQRDGEGGGK